MPTYPVTIRRCQHIKVNGIQCGSPALRDHPLCHFHTQSTGRHDSKCKSITLSNLSLEDANSIQFGLSEVIRLLISGEIDYKVGTLILRVLRVAATNVKYLSLEPPPTQVVIDVKSVEHRPLNASAWSTVEGKDYDYNNDNDPSQQNAAPEKSLDDQKEHDNSPYSILRQQNPGFSHFQLGILLYLTQGNYSQAEKLRQEGESFLKLNPSTRRQIASMFEKYQPNLAPP